MSVDLRFDYFNKLPIELKEGIWDYLDDESSLHTPIVCKEWHENPLLQEKVKIANEVSLSMVEGYPRKLIELFRKCKQSISEMPMLQQRDRRMHQEEPISVNLPDMPQSIMKFQESFGSAIAMKVKVVANETVPYFDYDMRA